MPAFSAFCVAAPRSGEGKTTAAMALCRALRERGLAVQAFKCGPDYVDPTFLATASGRRALNLDTWLMGENGVRRIFARAGRQAGVCVVEGVMGLFDGRGPGDLSGSTLDCARVLGLPVILTVNVRGMAASVAPLVAGFLDSARRHGVRIAGVLAQNAGSERHTAMLKAALEEAGLPPLLGSLPRDPAFTLPSRQLGLTPADETAGAERVCAALGKSLAEHADLDTLLALTEMERPKAPVTPVPAEGAGRKRLAVARDSAFCFYYEENLAWLTAHGWDIIPFSPLADRALPPCDAVYLGGGYPEVFAGTLSANKGMRDSVRHAALHPGDNAREAAAQLRARIRQAAAHIRLGSGDQGVQVGTCKRHYSLRVMLICFSPPSGRVMTTDRASSPFRGISAVTDTERAAPSSISQARASSA